MCVKLEISCAPTLIVKLELSRLHFNVKGFNYMLITHIHHVIESKYNSTFKSLLLMILFMTFTLYWGVLLSTHVNSGCND